MNTLDSQLENANILEIDRSELIQAYKEVGEELGMLEVYGDRLEEAEQIVANIMNDPGDFPKMVEVYETIVALRERAGAYNPRRFSSKVYMSEVDVGLTYLLVVDVHLDRCYEVAFRFAQELAERYGGHYLAAAAAAAYYINREKDVIVQ